MYISTISLQSGGKSFLLHPYIGRMRAIRSAEKKNSDREVGISLEDFGKL